MTVALVWAQAANGVIGQDGTLPWHLPEDLARFRALTMGSTVVMGRRTWESLPARFRPLPGRRNIVLTRRPDWQAPGAEVAGSLDDALGQVSGDAWVIGGASVYLSALDRAERVVVTELAEAFEGDVYAPRLDDTWRQYARDPDVGWHASSTGLRYRVTTFTRVG